MLRVAEYSKLPGAIINTNSSWQCQPHFSSVCTVLFSIYQSLSVAKHVSEGPSYIAISVLTVSSML